MNVIDLIRAQETAAVATKFQVAICIHGNVISGRSVARESDPKANIPLSVELFNIFSWSRQKKLELRQPDILPRSRVSFARNSHTEIARSNSKVIALFCSLKATGVPFAFR